MQRTTFSGLATIIVAGLLLAGCASKTLKPEEQSGYLKDYSDVTETKDAKGNTLYRYVNPKFNPGNYSAVILEPVEFYPKPEATDQVSQDTLDQLRNYVNQKLSQTVGDKVKVVDREGPGVARLDIAITSVVPQKAGLKAYQYIPIALVVTLGKRAVTGTPEDAKLVLEGRAADSVSGETLLKVVRAGTGEELKKVEGTRTMTVDDLKPLIDKWAEGVATQVGMFVRTK